MDDLPDDLEPGQEYQANAKFMMVQQKMESGSSLLSQNGWNC